MRRQLPLYKLGRIVTGKTPSSGHDGLFGKDHPFLTPSDMAFDDRVPSIERGITQAAAAKFKNQMLPAGATCVVCIGATIGKIARTNTVTLTNQQINSVVPDPEFVDSDYLYYLLRTVAPSLSNLASGAATPILNKSSFADIRVAVCDLASQRRIADILSAYDDLIENNTRRIAILEEMARSLFEEWFGRAGPDDWHTVKLRTIAAINPESLKPKSPPACIGYIDIASVSPGRVDEVQWMEFNDAPGRARRIVRDGDVIWSNVRPNRRSYALLLNVEADTIASTGFSVLRARSVPWSYLYMATTTADFTAYLTNRAKGSAYPAVGSEDFGDADVLRPNHATLARFHAHVGPMLELAGGLHIQNANLRTTRDLLLPKLISGEIEVRAAEEELEAAAA